MKLSVPFSVLSFFVLITFAASCAGQEIFIPDPGLNTAIRQTLQKPIGPLSQQDLLTLTNLDASNRNIRSINGLEAAHSLVALGLQSNLLTNFTLPNGITNLAFLDLSRNSLTNVTLSPDTTRLTNIVLSGNPLTTVVLSETLAATNLAETVSLLENQGIPVFTYPLSARLVKPQTLIAAFVLGVTGPPGIYAIESSTNMLTWTEVGIVTNPLGKILFRDVSTNLCPQKFYRTRQL